MQLIDTATHAIEIADDIQPPFRRHLLPLFWNQCHLLRQDFERKISDALFGSHFEIQLDLNSLLQDPDITILDVSPILPQMDCNHVGAAEFCQRSSPHRIGLDRFSSLPYSCDVVDIDTKCGHVDFLN